MYWTFESFSFLCPQFVAIQGLLFACGKCTRHVVTKRMAAKRKKSAKARKPWFLYLVECEDLSIYTGIAVDVGDRYAAHLKGTGARYTRSHPPRKLLAVVEYKDRSAASQAEYLVKQMSAGEKRAFARTVLQGFARSSLGPAS